MINDWLIFLKNELKREMAPSHVLTNSSRTWLEERQQPRDPLHASEQVRAGGVTVPARARGERGGAAGGTARAPACRGRTGANAAGVHSLFVAGGAPRWQRPARPPGQSTL